MTDMNEQSIVEQVLNRTDLKEPERFCKDCKHCRRRLEDFFIGAWFSYQFAMCRRPTGAVDPVSGRPELVNDYCSVERGDYKTLDVCRRSGRYWAIKKTA